MKNGKQPIHFVDEDSKDRNDSNPGLNYLGLTKREYFSALSMQGILAGGDEGSTITSILEALGLNKDTKYTYMEHYPAYIAKLSINYADELLKQLEKQ